MSFKFEMILKSRLLSQKCRQREQHIEDNKTSISICNEARGSFIKFQSKVPTQSKDINQL